MKKKKIIIIFSVIIFAVILVMIGIVKYADLGEGWNDIAYCVQLNREDITLYTDLDGECEVEQLPAIEGKQGEMLNDEEVENFMAYIYIFLIWMFSFQFCSKDDYDSDNSMKNNVFEQ